MELLYYKDEDQKEINDDILINLITLTNKQTETHSQAIYRISPVVSIRHNKNKEFVYPKIKVASEEDLKVDRQFDFNEDLHLIKNKFDVKENVFGQTAKPNEPSESNFIDVVDPEYNLGEFQLKQQEDEEEQRKNLDKYNLFRGFHFALDVFANQSTFTHDEDFTDCNVEFENLDNRIENLFGISKY